MIHIINHQPEVKIFPHRVSDTKRPGEYIANEAFVRKQNLERNDKTTAMMLLATV
ncbi:hypothetical protein DPMN_036068 [Dreissena polymorpha]|uniref:Uncharacterized protein n=1 Tax=Dreissena polymorpha TaxID=45954 RepID=A0A9D4MAU8_DREPO|nr:hypothetical protein DPMN_036068 [Dreissena polymorpha]